MSLGHRALCHICNEPQCVRLLDATRECRFRYLFEDGELTVDEIVSAIDTIVDDETLELRERIERMRRVRFELETRLSDLVRRQS